MRAGLIASGLLLLPLSGLAQSGAGSAATEGTPMQGDNFARPSSVQTPAPQPSSMQPPTSASRGAAGTVRNVNASFQDTVADECRYTASVRGTVREVMVEGATADNAIQYRPRLQIQAQLSCPNGSARQVSSFTLDGPQFGREQLGQAIADHARIFVRRGGQVCSYAPRLAFESGRLAGNGIEQSCMTQRGGGPPDTLQNPTSPFVSGGTRGGVISAPPGLGGSGARARQPIGGGPRDTIDQTDTMQGQHGVDPRTNPAFAPPRNGIGAGTGRDVVGTPRAAPHDGMLNPILP